MNIDRKGRQKPSVQGQKKVIPALSPTSRRHGSSADRDRSDHNRDREFDNRDREFDNRDRGFDNRDRGFDNRDRGFDNRDRGFDNRDREFDNRDREFDNRDREFDKRDREINNRDREFDNRDRGLDNRDRGLDNRDREIDNRDREFDNRDREFDNRDREFDNRDRGFDNRDREFDNGEREFDKRDREFDQRGKNSENRYSAYNTRDREYDDRDNDYDKRGRDYYQGAKEYDQNGRDYGKDRDFDNRYKGMDKHADRDGFGRRHYPEDGMVSDRAFSSLPNKATQNGFTDRGFGLRGKRLTPNGMETGTFLGTYSRFEEIEDYNSGKHGRGGETNQSYSELERVNEGGWTGVVRKRPRLVSENIKVKSVGSVCGEFATTTTLHGPLHLLSATHPLTVSRVLWAVIFVISLGILFTHIAFLHSHYLSYPISQQRERKEGLLPFPSVTVCNLNPVRTSKLAGNAKLKTFVEKIQEIIAKIDLQNMTTWDVDNLQDFADTLTAGKDYYDYTSISSGVEPRFTVVDSSAAILAQFYAHVTSVSKSSRIDMGHTISNVIQKCVFNGKKCSSSDFYHRYYKQYGNCFTFNSDVSNISLSRRPGLPFGLSLELLRESHEYMSGLTTTSGFRVVVHPYNTLPFPRENGFSISPGTETAVKINYEDIQRLGKPYQDCSEASYLSADYKTPYTQDLCEYTCAAREIYAQCKCVILEDEVYYPLAALEKSTPSCNLKKADLECATKIIHQIELGTKQPCECPKPCSDSSIDVTLSSSGWPDVGLWNTLVRRMCSVDQSASSSCMMFLSKDNTTIDLNEKDRLLKNDLAALNVYIDEYSEVTEKAVYPFVAYAADLGGVLAVWLGLSFISIVEVLNLVAELGSLILNGIRSACHNNWSRRPPPSRARWVTGNQFL